MKGINTNETVLIKLTDSGKEILRKNHEKLQECYPSMEEYKPKKEDEDGWSEWRLHVVMRTFGEHLVLGLAEKPFETTIRFKENK